MKASLDDVKLVNIRNHPDANGNLGFLEAEKDVPFRITRMFYVFGVHPNDIRGQHAHKLCRQFLICVHGRVEVECDDGEAKRKYMLDSPLIGLSIPPTIWAEQRYFSSDTMLFVLADQLFSEEDYIRDYATFLKLRGMGVHEVER